MVSKEAENPQEQEILVFDTPTIFPTNAYLLVDANIYSISLHTEAIFS